MTELRDEVAVANDKQILENLADYVIEVLTQGSLQKMRASTLNQPRNLYP